MKLSKVAMLAAMLVSTMASATGLPAPDFSKWASNTLQQQGINDARVVETQYPFSFTYCRKDSPALWRYDVMSADEIAALKEGRIVKASGQKVIAVESDSAACRSAS